MGEVACLRSQKINFIKVENWGEENILYFFEVGILGSVTRIANINTSNRKKKKKEYIYICVYISQS